jgi:hypothetical protein
MPYRVPLDLPKVPTEWRPFPLLDRIKTVVSDTRAYPLWAQQAAVALTTIEQPRDVPVHNPAGIMCQGLSFDPQPNSTSGGWGWGRGAWNRAGVKPCGYALLREGLSGNHPPFLAFASIADSMRFVTQQCFEDGGTKYDGDDYCDHWFGITPDNVMYKGSRILFNAKLAQVVSQWPSDVTVTGYRDAGASA